MKPAITAKVLLTIIALMLIVIACKPLVSPETTANAQATGTESDVEARAGGDVWARIAAVASLNDRASLAEYAQHPEYLTGQIAELRLFMMDPSVEKRLGVTKLAIERKTIPQPYYEIKNPQNTGMMIGEAITFSVSGGNLHSKQIKTWITHFPGREFSLHFISADLDIAELVTMLLKYFPQDELEMFAMKSESPNVREAAVENLTDQAVIAKVAEEEKDPSVINAVFKRLTDQALMAKLAVEAKHCRDRATEHLTDQALLSKIAVEDNSGSVRAIAISRLVDTSRRTGTSTDQALLSKIAVEDNDWYVRATAVGGLIDQELLSRIAAEDRESYVRELAKGRLIMLRATKP
jgi:hypothetical protein